MSPAYRDTVVVESIIGALRRVNPGSHVSIAEVRRHVTLTLGLVAGLQYVCFWFDKTKGALQLSWKDTRQAHHMVSTPYGVYTYTSMRTASTTRIVQRIVSPNTFPCACPVLSKTTNKIKAYRYTLRYYSTGLAVFRICSNKRVNNITYAGYQSIFPSQVWQLVIVNNTKRNVSVL